MAAHENHIPLASSMASTTASPSPTLLQRLAVVLPKDVSFKIHHLSTPPTKSPSIFSAPPGARPERTYCESHFLTASINVPVADNGTEFADVLVYAIEILLYSTAYNTTFFVSKADSTGFLHLLNLPKGTSSPLKHISATFLEHLVAQHRRPNIRNVISLFARAQDQYLFPGSVEYSGKHVLDDGGLIRWWCRVLDPLITGSNASKGYGNIEGYLIVPGLDSYETSSYFPRKPVAGGSPWTMGHPLYEISRHSNNIPPRALIPHFPDDPKARYLDELDEEITKEQTESSGQWKSVKTIEQFWDMMAFRQECSAGRRVGFIWVVFNPQPTENLETSTVAFRGVGRTPSDSSSRTYPITPSGSFSAPTEQQSLDLSPPPLSPAKDTPKLAPKRRTTPKRKKLTGPIITRQPKSKTGTKNYFLKIPESTAYYYWPSSGRGQVVVQETDYKRINELLLRLDFANIELALSSSKRWTNEVRSGAPWNMKEAWGQIVTGTKAKEDSIMSGSAGANTLSVGLVRKKRKVDDVPPVVAEQVVNVIGPGVIRKKPKVLEA
ncbi:hypothetical protein HYALB_00004830 [Hymenoscyphus albidus]|uniref:histone acetyltransferase n=1 Tax=Hymenoscyphus albidus TaxID=595503 RepID=A0A9N9M0V4_9HELO|nr:hypothetical protein HYALB_00004830 [Hymenoscyphus albidus]